MARGYTAHAAVTAECGADGRTRLTRLKSDGPISLRETPDGVYIVGAAAGPLGGDRLRLEIVVGAGASLTIRSVASAMAMPGQGESVYTVTAQVDGHLDFAPEPTIAVKNCDHRAVNRVVLGEHGTVRWVDELVLGRHREEPGRHVSRIDITRGGMPVLRHELRLDESARSRAVLGSARAVGSLIQIGPGLSDAAATGDGCGAMPLADGAGVLVTALADDSATLRERLVTAEQQLLL